MTPSEYGRSVAYRGMATRQLAEKTAADAATKTVAIPSVDQLLDHPAAPWVVLPAVGAGGGLLLNELGRIYAAIQGRKADEQQERLNRWTSAGVGAGIGLAPLLREKLQQLFRSSTTGGNLVAKAASASQYGRALALRAMADPFGG